MKVYFDMDGVLVNFSAMCPNDTNLNHPSETLSDEKRAAKKLFWQNIEKQPNFWRDIPMMANIEYLLTTAADIGEIFVLSKVPGAEKFIGGQNYVDFVAGEKRKWIAKHMNKFFDAKHIIICDGPKGKLIRPNKTDVLIDDRQENINEWESVGGRGILFNDAFSAKKQLIYMKNNMREK